ncbi:MAG: hypothetical protein U0930_20065 [Pirellulales bacterium]
MSSASAEKSPQPSTRKISSRAKNRNSPKSGDEQRSFAKSNSIEHSNGRFDVGTEKDSEPQSTD